MDRRTFLKAGGAAASIGATGLSGCLGFGGVGDGGTPTIRASYVVPIENFVSLMAIPEMQEQFDNLGTSYELEIESYASTPDIINGMASEEIDFGLPAYASFPAAINQSAVPGGMTAIVSGIYDAHPDYFSFPVYAMEDSGISSAEDLEGKQIGVNATGTGVHAIIYRMLTQVGIDPEDDVQFVEIQFPAMGSALRDGRIDAGIFVSTFAAAQRAEGGITTVFDSHDAWGQAYPFVFIAGRNDYLDENPDAVSAFVEDYVSMIGYSYDNREQVIGWASNHFEIPEPALQSFYLTQDDYYRPRDGRIDVEALQFAVDSLEEMGFIDTAPSMSDHVTDEFLPG